VANANRRINSIESLSVNDSSTLDPDIISSHIVSFYESLFSESISWRPRVDNLEFEVLSVDEMTSLEDPFEEQEVIKGMDRDTALGPDGFSLAFFLGLLGGGEKGFHGGLCGFPFSW
jgi:hypothetical protein